MRTSEVLNRAADLIEERGWTRGGDGVDPWGAGAGSNAPICLEGGILAALGVSMPVWDGTFSQDREDALEALEACPAYTAVADYLGGQRPYYFNDGHGRTRAEVIEVLRATAVIEAAREEARVEVSA